MSKKKLGVGLILSFVLVTGVVAVEAAPTTDATQPQPSFTDGRINAFDAGAPVAIFDTHQDIPRLGRRLAGVAILFDLEDGEFQRRLTSITTTGSANGKPPE